MQTAVCSIATVTVQVGVSCLVVRPALDFAARVAGPVPVVARTATCVHAALDSYGRCAATVPAAHTAHVIHMYARNRCYRYPPVFLRLHLCG
jgi:hypothetical protein